MVDCIDHVGFSQAANNQKGGVVEYQICNYADMRVSPHGVISMKERINEAHKRYQGKKHSIAGEKFEVLVRSLEAIEKHIFENSHMLPTEITDEKVARYVEELKWIKNI